MRKEMLEQHVHIALVLPVRESVALLQVAPSSPKSAQGLSLHLSVVNAHCPYLCSSASCRSRIGSCRSRVGLVSVRVGLVSVYGAA